MTDFSRRADLEPLRIGIVASAGGAAFEATLRVLAHRPAPAPSVAFHVITDRPCGIERVAEEAAVSHQRIQEVDNRLFSQRVRQALDQAGGVDVVLLLFSRLVTQDLFAAYPTANIHPGLLPAFPGLSPTRQALARGVRFVGATLHAVDETVDAGQIIAQTCMPIPSDADLTLLNRYAFIQKTYLAVLLVHLFERGYLHWNNRSNSFHLQPGLTYTDRCNPWFDDPRLIAGLCALQREWQVDIVH